MWVLFPVNTSSSTTSQGHWLLCAFLLHDVKPKVRIIDPLEVGDYSKHVYDSFVLAMGDFPDCVACNLAGTQQDDWSCGYQVLWFLVLFLLPGCSRMQALDELTKFELPAPPSDWAKVVCLLLMYLDSPSRLYLMDIAVVNTFFADYFHLPYDVLKFAR
jgi:hypothetical protein